ncbi:hypothetical protein POM88_003953 [Heracleum sosnowskyi]|uniref:HECT-type E3 ubiquitin transferase n=1 Tax=Heracleum sosnowskyi TaxID=360622 RepID=A0AAD8JIF7_9APIA|nr:hypothetical protein POM88_003953 [Heracleum sosnowskyi]
MLVKSTESKILSDLDKIWLKEYNLLHTLFFSLIGKLDSGYRKLNEEKFTYRSLVSYDRTLQITTCISKEIVGGEIELENLLEDYKEEHGVMHRIGIIIDLGFCPDDALLFLDFVMSKSEPELKKRIVLSVIPKIREGVPFEFEKEEGIGPGVTKEWMYLVTQSMLHPTYNYFKSDTDDKRKLLSSLEPVQDLGFYNFLGRIMALSLMNSIQMSVSLDPILIRMLAELEVTLDDVKKSDALLYKNLKIDVNSHLGSMLKDQLVLEEKDRKDESEIIKEYSKVLLNDTFIQDISGKVAEIIKGFDCVFGNPQRRRILFQTIEPSHLDMVLYGDQNDISVEDWECHTKYNRDDDEIRTFWKVVADFFSAEQRRDLLFFWASMRFLPPGGFGNLKDTLSIEKNKAGSYPTASTCTNTLRIPSASNEELKRQAIQQPAKFGLE